jgi:hypothetical protein
MVQRSLDRLRVSGFLVHNQLQLPMAKSEKDEAAKRVAKSTSKFVRKELQGDVATELEVFCFIDHTHTAAADLAEDAVMRNPLPHGLGGHSHWREMVGRFGAMVNRFTAPSLQLGVLCLRLLADRNALPRRPLTSRQSDA